MFKAVAVVAAVALLSLSASATLLHVHASGGHAHAEHHHGPAAHSHAPVSLRHHHPHVAEAHGHHTTIAPCDPADHVVPLAFVGVTAAELDLPVPTPLGAPALIVPETAVVAVSPADVRAHSPPRITDAPLRAPPPAHLA